MIIPIDLVVISNNLFPSDLSESQLADIAYAKWYKVTEPRIGKCLAVSSSEVKEISFIEKAKGIEDNGFSFKNIVVEAVSDSDKKWNEIKGFFI